MSIDFNKNYKKPRDAASLVLLKYKNSEPHVLMGRRHPHQVFMPNIFVFPGGAVERRDGFVESKTDFQPATKSALLRHCTPHRGRAIALAGIRETFEETGLMVGEPEQHYKKPLPENWASFQESGIKPRLDILTFIARAITPRGLKRRFHARFFLASARHAHGALKTNGELLDLDWYPLKSVTENLPIASVTELVLQEIAAALNGKNHTISFDIPLFTRRKGKRMIRYDAGNGQKLIGLFESIDPV